MNKDILISHTNNHQQKIFPVFICLNQSLNAAFMKAQP